jgi:spore germination protein KC
MKNQSLSDLTIVQGVGIDSVDDKTRITLQYLDTSKPSSSSDALQDSITAVEQGTATSISDAISTASKSLSKTIFFGQNKIIVFGNEYVQNSLSKGVDYLMRSIDSRPDVLVAVSSDSAQDIIKSTEKGALLPAESIYDLLDVGEKHGLGAVVSVNDLLSSYADSTCDMFMPELAVDGDKVKCTGIAVFSDDDYTCTLNEYQTFGFLFVCDKIDGGSIMLNSDKLGNIGLEINSSKTKCSVDIVDSKPVFNINVSCEFLLNEIENGISTAIDDDVIDEIENLANKKIKRMCKSAVTICYSNKSDPFKTAKYVAKADEDYYNRVKNNWHEMLKDVEVNISVESTLEKVNDNSVRQ